MTSSSYTQNTHTKGPWAIVPQSAGGPMIAHPFDTGKQMNPRGLRLICHVLTRGNSIAEDDANARLIAASPDLLEALQRITDSANDLLNEMVSNPKKQGNWGGLAAHVQIARAAIRRATQGSGE